MASTAPSQPPTIAGEAARLLDEFTVCHAADLARERAYDGAEALLRPLTERLESPLAALHLLGKIHAQQGRFSEAALCWQKVLDREPANATAQTALSRLYRARRPAWLQVGWPLLVAAGAIVCFSLVLFWQWRRQDAVNTALREHVAQAIAGQGQARAHDLEILSTESKALESRLASILQSGTNQVDALTRIFRQDLASVSSAFAEQQAAFRADAMQWVTQHEIRAQAFSNQMAQLNQAVAQQSSVLAEVNRQRTALESLQVENRALAARHESVPAQVLPTTNAPKLAIDIAGVKAKAYATSLSLVFEEGLFDHGVHLKLGAKDRLRSIANALAQSAEPLKIEVLGYADDDRPFLKWSASWESSLAWDRATAVVKMLDSLALFRTDALTARIGERGTRPFPSDSDLNRARNRTVILRATNVK